MGFVTQKALAAELGCKIAAVRSRAKKRGITGSHIYNPESKKFETLFTEEAAAQIRAPIPLGAPPTTGKKVGYRKAQEERRLQALERLERVSAGAETGG